MPAKKRKTKFYPVAQYKRPPSAPPKGYEWLKVRKLTRVSFRRPRYETAYVEQYNRRKRKYEIKKYRILTGYRKSIGRTHIKYWSLHKTAVVTAEKWITIQRYIAQTKDKLNRKHGKIPLVFKHEIYKDTKGRFFRYLETNTMFNYHKAELDPNKKYVLAIVYYLVKLSGYKGHAIQFEKMSFGHFDRPMNVYDLSVYVRNTLVGQIKEYLKKSKHVSFERYMYFGALAEHEIVYMRGTRRYPSKAKQREFEKKQRRFTLNPKGIK